MRVSERRSERSVVTVLAVAVVSMALSTALVLASLGVRVVSTERAGAVADASALAGVTGGQQAAGEVARANGAVLARLDHRGDTVVVSVQRSGITARAAARPTTR